MALPFYSDASAVFTVLLSVVLLAISLYAGVYLSTTARFYYDVYRAQHGKQTGPFDPPQLPYAIPWLGNAMSFLVREPHKFWKQLFSWYPRSLGACYILLGGKRILISFDRHAAQYLMRDRELTRNAFNMDVLVKGMGLTRQECDVYWDYHIPGTEIVSPAHEEHEKFHLEYLMKADRVNELAIKFFDTFHQICADQYSQGSREINLYEWARSLIFRASTTALLGSKILDVCTNLEAQFFQFDQDMLSMFFGLPRFMIARAYANREATIKSMTEWHNVVMKESGGQIADPASVAWEPLYGGRLNRRRQQFYRKSGLGPEGWARMDLGILFGITSNATPAVGWMLLHILDSARPENRLDKEEKTLYEHVMQEIQTARKPDGSIDILILLNSPILNSVLHEVLRVYVDVLITRILHKDVTLPLHNPKSTDTTDQSRRSIYLKKGSILMAPSWPAHHDPSAWESPFPHHDHPPPTTFYPYRFLTTHPDDLSQKPVFTTSHTTGAFFPFGGGRTICTGRAFAKQEILTAVAVILGEFTIEPVGFVDINGQPTDKFPGLRDSLPGSAVMVANGDMKVRIRNKRMDC